MGGQRGKKKVNRGGRAKQQNKSGPITAAIAQSPPAQVVPVKQTDTGEHKEVRANQDAQNGEKIYRLEVWQHRFTFALVVATFVQAAFAVRQWTAMTAQNDIMLRQMDQTDDTLEIMRHAERADIFVRVSQNGKLAPNKPIAFDFSLVNTGKRVGMVDHFLCVPVVTDSADHDVEDEVHQTVVNSLYHGRRHLEVFADETLVFPLVIDAPSPAEMAAIAKGTKTLRLVVGMTFSDPIAGHKSVGRAFNYSRESGRFEVDEQSYYDQWIKNLDESPYKMMEAIPQTDAEVGTHRQNGQHTNAEGDQ